MPEDCACARCKSLCRNPGWFDPAEARKAIDAGYANKIMVDYWVRSSGNIFILSPASKGCEKDRAPNTDELGGFSALVMGLSAKGQCVLQAEDGLCSIHTSGFKPAQCRAAKACEGNAGIENEVTARLWDNPESQALVREWMAIVGLDERELSNCH